MSPLLVSSNAGLLHVAVSTLFTEQSRMYQGKLLVIKPASAYANQRAVMLADISDVLAFAHPATGRQQYGQEAVLGASNVSQSKCLRLVAIDCYTYYRTYL